MIRLKLWEFLRSAVCQQRFPGTVSLPGERGCVKKHEHANAFNLVRYLILMIVAYIGVNDFRGKG